MLKTAFPFKGTDTVNSLVLGANFTPDDQTRQVITSVYFFLSVHLLICFYPTQLHRGLIKKERDIPLPKSAFSSLFIILKINESV